MVTSNNSPFVDVKTQTSLNKQGGGFTLPQRTLSEGDMKGAAAYYIMYCYKLLLFYNSQRVALKRFNPSFVNCSYFYQGTDMSHVKRLLSQSQRKSLVVPAVFLRQLCVFGRSRKDNKAMQSSL